MPDVQAKIPRLAPGDLTKATVSTNIPRTWAIRPIRPIRPIPC